MHILHLAIQEDGDLRSAIGGVNDRVSQSPAKLGLILDLNPYWALAHRISSLGLDYDSWQYGALLWPFSLEGSLGPQRLSDLRREYPYVEPLTVRAFGRPFSRFSPYLLRIVADRRVVTENPDLHTSLKTAAREAPLPTIVEVAEPPRLLAKATDALTCPGGATGTLGGFLRDANDGSVYGVTCGHVVPSGTVQTASGALGHCAHAIPPALLGPHGSCHTTATVTTADLALLSFPAPVLPSAQSSVAPIISNGDTVVMDGRNGKVTYMVGGAVVNHYIGNACWDKLFQIHAPVPPGIIPVGVHVALTPPPTAGDSGAWLYRGFNEWAAMVVAADALHGFALAATTVVGEANAAFTMALAPA